MITLMLVWFLIGYISGSYVLLVDVCDGVEPVDRPLTGVIGLLACGIVGPFILCYALYVAYISTEE